MTNNREKQREYSRKWREKNRPKLARWAREWRATCPDKIKRAGREGQRKRHYGISSADYYRMVCFQLGRCKICKCRETETYRGKVKALSVDHCHKTGRIRGLLCSACNHGLGKFRDDPSLLAAAIQYLEDSI